MNALFSLTRSARRKRTLALHIAADGTVQVQAPLRTSLKWIQAFVAERSGWIEKRRKEIESQRRAQTALRLTPETPVPFMGQNAPLAHFCPEAARLDDPAELRLELLLWYKKQARRELPARAALWAEKTGLRPRKIVVANQRQRWGSCNEKNEIRLNWKLILFDPEQIDYVILHELSHIPHKDHSRRFWAQVAAFMPDWKRRRQALRVAERDPVHHLLA